MATESGLGSSRAGKAPRHKAINRQRAADASVCDAALLRCTLTCASTRLLYLCVCAAIISRGKAAAAAEVVCATDVQLPFPVTVTGSRVLLSRKRWVVSLHLPKSRYPFSSFALQRYQSKREGCLVPSGLSDGGLVVISGLQASSKERFLISSRGTDQKPALVGLKETAMVFLQCSNEPMYQLATKELGVAVLVFNHGLLQDHCSGVPWADLSVCVLRHETLNEVVRHWSQIKTKEPVRHVNCSPEELELFKEFDRAFQQQVLTRLARC